MPRHRKISIRRVTTFRLLSHGRPCFLCVDDPRHHYTRQTSCRVVEGQVVQDDLLGLHYSRSREMRGRRADQANTWIIISMVWEHTFPLQIFQVLLTLWTGCRHSNASCGSTPFCLRLACLQVAVAA